MGVTSVTRHRQYQAKSCASAYPPASRQKGRTSTNAHAIHLGPVHHVRVHVRVPPSDNLALVHLHSCPAHLERTLAVLEASIAAHVEHPRHRSTCVRLSLTTATVPPFELVVHVVRRRCQTVPVIHLLATSTPLASCTC